MSALGHYLEDEGVATTLVSLVRLHSEVMRPPRALWVPYELGRPLGPPNDAALQRQILMAALGLLESDQGPAVHADFDPGIPPEQDWHCPFETGRAAPWPEDAAEAGRLLLAEFGRVMPWYERAAARLGRTTVGLAHLAADALGDHVAAGYGAIARGADLPASPVRGLHRMQALRFAVDDLKACYMEAAVADAGRPSCRQLNRWFWRQTLAGQLVVELAEQCLRSDDRVIRKFGESYLITEEYL